MVGDEPLGVAGVETELLGGGVCLVGFGCVPVVVVFQPGGGIVCGGKLVVGVVTYPEPCAGGGCY